MTGETRLTSIEAEQAVLGAALIDPDAFGVAQEASLAVDHFARADHRLLWSAFETMAGRGMPIDFLTVGEYLGHTGRLDAAGGDAYLAELVSGTPSAANTFAYARIVVARAVQRRWFGALSQARDRFLDPACAAALDEGRGHARFSPIREVMKAEVDAIGERYERPGIHGLETGYHNIDHRLGGLQPGELVIVGARPGMGKTAYALNIVRQVGLQRKPGAVLVYSLEMTGGALVQRLLAAQGKVKKDLLRSAKVFDHQDSVARLTAAAGALMDLDIRICDTPGLTVRDIRAMALAERRRHGVRLVVVDYLGLVEFEGRDRSTADQVAEMTKTLKRMARELGCPVLLLAQLNREVDKRANKRPVLPDLRDSGAIEQDADVVQFLYRDEYYYKEKSDHPGQVEVITAKCREGEIGSDYLTWLGQYQLMESNSTYDRPAPAGGGYSYDDEGH